MDIASSFGSSFHVTHAISISTPSLCCSPLRLLACEVAERLGAAGVPCRLVTGQEVAGDGRSRHVSCTVEMASLTEEVEVCGCEGIVFEWRPSPEVFKDCRQIF